MAIFIAMDEYFLHYLWKFQKFDHTLLQTVTGHDLIVFDPGHGNKDAGPDFLLAKLKINGLEWSGPVEVHHRSSDWNAHGHTKDQKYATVILHVVWVHDEEITYPDGQPIPTFCLKDYVKEDLEQAYRHYINQPSTIRCSGQSISDLQIIQLKDQAAIERLESRASEVFDVLHHTNDDWEETAFRIVCKNFGFSVNKDPFISLGTSIPYKTLKKHRHLPDQIEALLFGQAGFLEAEPVDDHHRKLQNEYRFLQKKHSLQPALHQSNWNFLRLRPPNFPTVRLSQLATLLVEKENLFSWIIESDVESIRKAPTLNSNPYWSRHYDFGKPWKSVKSSFGQQSWENILINSVVPIQAAYSKALDQQELLNRAIDLLQAIKPESNKFTREWEVLGLKVHSAYDSQALLHQYRSYCTKKRCLQCNIGVSILEKA